MSATVRIQSRNESPGLTACRWMFVLFLVSFWGTETSAQGSSGWLSELAPVRSFRSFDRTNTPGLPQSTVMALHQDERGVLWAATLDGVGIFDGNGFERVSGPGHPPTLGPFFSLAAGSAGEIHVGGSSFVHSFDGEEWRRMPAPGGAPFLAVGSGGYLWRLDNGGGVWRADLGSLGDSWKAAPIPDGWKGPAVALASGPKGALWLAGTRDVYRREGGDWVSHGASAPAEVSALLPASDGSVWIGTRSSEVFYLDAGGSRWTAVDLPPWPGGRVRALEEDRRGRIWAGGLDGGVVFGRRNGSWTAWGPENGLHREGCLAILADREGTIWFSANGHGLQQWIGEAWSHRNRWQNDEWAQHRVQIFGITSTSDEGVIASVFDRGLWRWTGSEMRELGGETGLSEDVRSADEVEPGKVWVATRFGIFESDGEGRFRRTLEIDSGFVFGFHRSPDGTWLASTAASGLFRRVAGRWEPMHDLNRHLPNLGVRAVLWRSSRELWVGTLGGVRVFVDGQPKNEGIDSELEAVHALFSPDGSAVWVGGAGGIEIHEAGAVQRLRAEDGLPGNTIYSLVEASDGSIWAGGSAGAGRYRSGRWRVYGIGSGLLEEECNHLGLHPLENGSLLVGTMASLAVFDASVTDLPRPPLAVYWRSPTTNHEAYREPFRLPAEERSVRLAWHAPWLAPDRIEYRVRIPRLDEEWSPPQSQTSSTLENLDAGSWEVQVAARFVGQDIWTEPAVSRFYIEPFFWETWTFRGALLAAVLLLLVGIVRWRTRRLAGRAAALEAAVQESVAQIKVLGGLLPICSSCKKVRDDAGYWQQIESYIRTHSEADFSHGLCPSCFDELYSEFAEFPASAPQSSRATASPRSAKKGSGL